MFLCILTIYANSHTKSCIESVLSNKMNSDSVNGHFYSFAWISMFLNIQWSHFFFWWIIFFTNFPHLAKKWRNLTINEKFEFFAKCTSKFLALHLRVWRGQMPLEGLSFVKMLARDSLLIQNIIRIVCLCWFIFIFWAKNPRDHADLCMSLFQNQTSCPRALSR